jgi:phenylpropionate dioxygenase-like ring-hydroxylating dioxygenase large terminal subunit
MEVRIKPRLTGDLSTLVNRVAVSEILSAAPFANERAKIFRHAWLPVGHTTDLPHNGSYFVLDVPLFKTSLLVVRETME